MQSESAAAAAGAAGVWTLVSVFTVPAGVISLKKIKVSFAPDPGAVAAHVHGLPVFRLTGAGLLEQSPHFYVGEGVDCIEIAASTGMVAAEVQPRQYEVDIPVQTGGQIQVDSLLIAETLVGTMRAELVYDNIASVAPNNMGDYVTATMPASAGAWTTVGTLTVPQLTTQNSPKIIKRVDCGFIVDSAGGATSKRFSSRFRISGSGVGEPGNHYYLGSAGCVANVAAGSGAVDRPLVQHNTVIPVNPGGQILVETILDAVLSDGGDSIFAVQYA